MEWLNNERLMFLSVIAGIIFVGVINSEPVVIKEVPTPAPRTSSLAVGYQTPTKVTPTKKNSLMVAYKSSELQGTPKLNKELNKVFKENVNRHWGVNRNIQNGNESSLDVWGEDYIRWTIQARDKMYALIVMSGYTTEELNDVLDDGTIEEFNEKTQEIIAFLDVYFKEKKNEK